MKKKIFNIILPISYLIFLLISWVFNFSTGITIGKNFYSFVLSMLKVLPFAFILIGLFEVWVKKETVEKHFGNASGYKGYLWAIILSSTTVGGAYVAFPVAYSLYNKGAKLSIVLTYIGGSALTRIPMTIFEASFLGIKFSIIRLLISIPLVILSSILISNSFEKKSDSKTKYQ
ncbi:permease [Dethiothermospora halolimnae]|uniref:permease n=1 Tax=Dethiothermospora halolimnae TaxID=3114390 RepID=UPI003CCC2D85